MPVYSNHRRLKYVAPPSTSDVQTICGIASASCRYRSSPCALERGELLQVQLSGLRLQLPGHLPELDEDRDLGAQDGRVDRLEDVVDRARGVAPVDVPLLLESAVTKMIGMCCDRSRLLDQLGELEPVELRHLHVEEDAREVVEQQLLQSRRRRGDRDEPVAERLEDRLKREQVLLAVVDEQDVRALLAHVPTSAQRP